MKDKNTHLCCKIPAMKGKSVCKECSKKGLPVKGITLKNLVKSTKLKDLKELEGFYFCQTSECDVVYFNNNINSYLYKNDIKVRVGIKEKKEPIPICYCFGWTKQRILNQIKETGHSTAIEEITRMVKEGKCACVIKNPSGRCCLSDVKKIVEEGLRHYKTNKRKVLFICTHNSARSQMAEGFLKSLYGNHYEVYSAGTKPFEINPYAIEVMKEIGIDISSQHSKSIDEFRNMKFDFVITICDHAKQTCPFFPRSKKYLHYNFEDPSVFEGEENEKFKIFQQVRDKIKDWIIKTFGDRSD
jgi:arsenate reductase